MSAESTGLDLKAFLTEQTREGQMDSQGAFTIAADKAMEKLSYFALPHESDWVLKVIQAANLWRVERVVVVQTRQATSFTFSPRPQPAQAMLVQAFGAVAPSNTDPLHALAMALRSLVEQVGLSFVLAFRRDGVTEEPIFAGDDTAQLSARTRARWAAQREDGIRLTVSHFRGDESVAGRYVPTFSKLDRRDISIMQVLQKRAFASPVPIYLDGRRISDPTQFPGMAVSHGYRLLATGRRDLADRFTPRVLPWDNPANRLRWHEDNPDRPWYLLRTADWRYFDLFMHYILAGPLPHRVVMTRQGVVCQTYRVLNACAYTSLLLVLPADDCRSDLSGLALEPSEQELSQLDEMRREVSRSLLELPLRLDSPSKTAPRAAPPTGPSAAGFSIFTASLGTPVKRVWGALADFAGLLQHHNITDAQKEQFLANWRERLAVELKQVAADFARGELQVE